MAYRNPFAWDRCKRPGLFVSDPNAELPFSDPDAFKQFDWMSDNFDGIDVGRTYTEEELDRMVAEL